ncbi:mediator of RNA polymerase II transcription subunit 12-like isoform X4 [Pomacea canaliculata]|uniref:mediator of RNA polymerase II transcription subunit 12-like isoform X4 n=1 Tax=Pomacea canaliculata TaxID=400727 RepID=UPI000D7316DD|nr:mediator of RNA polymerase II transcription subunit 12-like isoform X4 [Pomacea canaliculata]
MESLNCYYNVIKSIPEAITQLQLLTHLNLSRNQLAVLPVSLCVLSSLEVLCASNNKLVSLPEEIGKLDRLMDLDVSCNEISHLPPQIGDLSSLRSLNLRRNLLVELPLDICKLSLRKLDISSNRIEKIPTVFRKLETLEEIILEHNPLSSPPAHICTRGRQHIMKYLQIEAIREDRKRGILTDSEMKRPFRKSLPPQQTSDEFRNILDNPEPKWKRHTVLSSDSGYSTTESLDKVGWSQNEQAVVGELDESNMLAIKAAEAVREQRQGRDGYNHGGAHIVNHTAPEGERIRLHSSPTSACPQSPLTLGINGNHAPSLPGPSLIANSAQRARLPDRDFSQVLPATCPSPGPYQYPNYQQLSQQSYRPPISHMRSSSPSPLSNSQSHAPAAHISSHPLHGRLNDVHSLSYLQSSIPLPQNQQNEFRPPPIPIIYVDDEEITPPVTPPTPLAQHQAQVLSLEDEFSRELQRQKMEYEQRKKAAEQIRLQQEEKEREDRRRAALKVQEEQRALLEKQKQEMKLEAERRQQEENLRFEEQQRLLREQAQQEEEARLREEEARVQEEARIREEEKARAEAKQQEEARKGKAANTNNSIYEHPLPPHWAQPVHGSYHGYGLVQQDYQEYPLYEEAAHDSYFGMAEPYSSAPDNCLSEWEYRNALSSHSFKEQRRIANTQQYRRTTSDSAKRGIPTPINAHVDNHNHINRNGIADDDVSEPIPPLSPSLANPSSSKATTPTSTIPGLLRVQGGEKGSQSPAVRRSKGNERSNVPTPSAGRSVSRTSSTSSVNSVQSQGSSGRTPATSSTTNTSTTSTAVRSKNHITPNSTPKNARRTIGRIEGDNEKPQGRMYTQPSTTYSRLRPPTTSFRREEELKQKQQQQVKIQQQGESQKLKSRVEEQRGKAPAREGVAMGSKRQGASDGEDKRRSNQSRAGATTAGRGGRNAAVKVLEDYKDANPNFTVRRRDEMHREENQQLEMLRQTIESRLKVTLPDNLPEALRDGVVLCHLANLIRPRSVASIHVPSPAVPKLTLAKCRRNVENFLEACKKIGVDQEQICAPADIMDERGVQRVAITVAALVAIGTNPRQSAV